MKPNDSRPVPVLVLLPLLAGAGAGPVLAALIGAIVLARRD